MYNLSDKPIIYTGRITAFENPFLVILDRDNEEIWININNIIQIKKEYNEPIN